MSVLDYYKGKWVLVTGGTGLIGRAIVDMLVDAGAYVSCVSRDSLKLRDNVTYIYGNLADLSFCQEISRSQDIIFHMAGIKGSPVVTKSRPASFLVPLLMMNTNMLEAARVNNVPRLLYASSIGAYPMAEEFKEYESGGWVEAPMDEFPGWAKRMAEMQIEAYRQEFGIHGYSIVRPANVYGPGDNFDPDSAMVIPALLARAHKGENPLKVWGDGKAIRDFAYSEDVAYGMLQAVASEIPDLFVNLGSGLERTVREVAENVSIITGCRLQFQPQTGDNAFSRRVMSIEKARNLIGYNPTTSLYDGMKKTWDWFLEHSEEHLLKQNYFREWSLTDARQTVG